MTVALIFPPTCDPTAPYVSVPLLAGWLRAHGVEVLPLDANIGACEHLLRADRLGELRGRVDERYRRLNRRARLSHAEQGLYLTLLDCLEESADVPEAIEPALRRLRGQDPGFYEPALYRESTDTVERALRLVGAAYAPLELSFSAYRSPFSLLNRREREADARADRNPYHGYFGAALIPQLLGRGVSVVGLSVVFPGQIQPAYSLAHLIRADPRVAHLHLCVGGPAMTQTLGRLEGATRESALEPFDTAVMYEGEEALLGLVRGLEAGEHPHGIIRGSRFTELSSLPPPDFEGMPLDRYLSPEPVLPYDFSRGCPWGKCAFCHYGLADTGTAPYRERPLEAALRHLDDLRGRHGARIFYLSEDSVRPEAIRSLARGLSRERIGIRWSTDVRPEKLLGQAAVSRELREGGALSFSFGVESGSRRVLRLMRKGIPLGIATAAIRSAAAAGIAAEAMVFTDFPTETGPEALETLALLEELRESISLFMCGTFGLTSGSGVAREPERYGIRAPWTVGGDELELLLEYAPAQGKPWKSPREEGLIEERLGELSRRWLLSPYPWAGSLSTAHTLLWYDRMGPDVFRRLAALPKAPRRRRAARIARPRFDAARMSPRFRRNESRIWERMIHGERAVSRARYVELAAALSPARSLPARGAAGSG